MESTFVEPSVHVLVRFRSIRRGGYIHFEKEAPDLLEGLYRYGFASELLPGYTNIWEEPDDVFGQQGFMQARLCSNPSLPGALAPVLAPTVTYLLDQRPTRRRDLPPLITIDVRLRLGRAQVPRDIINLVTRIAITNREAGPLNEDAMCTLFAKRLVDEAPYLATVPPTECHVMLTRFERPD
ncbi:MAG: hypothetical protein HC876_13585 [Chloroflexaceae bacterium]|nr:hypothetical protein [Chloroflexaceae bacterium]NJO06466.1 hypothetical protein [Chloroflexaceae bacterium]